ncbi:MAG: fumarylacetoacetate hydrolase family protein [Bacillota bacterium]
MKYGTFKFNGRKRIGAVCGNYLVDVQRAYALYLDQKEDDGQADEMAKALIPADFGEFLNSGEKAWEAARKGFEFVKDLEKNILGINEEFIFYNLDDVKILKPYQPKTIMCAGPELEDPENKDMHDYIEFYLKSSHTVIDPGEAIYYEGDHTGRIDCEPELALVMGKKGRFLDEDNVLDHVFGYTVLSDVYSLDRLQVGWEGTMFHVRYGEGESFDNSAPLGPWVVTKDEIENPENLKLKKYVNGELVAESNTSDLLRSVKEFASYCSTFFTMTPDILISTGNPDGVVFGTDDKGVPVIKDMRENPVQLKPGDEVICEVENIAELKNPVVDYKEVK